MIRRYPVNSRYSTVNGSPGRNSDWSKFCWDGSAIYEDDLCCAPPGCIMQSSQAPLPWVDGRPDECQYLHVPWDWSDQQQIFRVRPNDTMWPGRCYHGLLITEQRAVKLADGWYWELEGEI